MQITEDQLPESLRNRLAQEKREVSDALSFAPDLVMIVLRLHLLIEYLMDRVLEAALPRGKEVTKKSANLTFAQKLAVANASALFTLQQVDFVAQLNSLRNECGHTRGRRITFEDIDRMGRPLGREYSDLRGEQSNASLEMLTITTCMTLYFNLFNAVSLLLYITEIDEAAEAIVKTRRASEMDGAA
jgi:hypothetical protein